MNQPSSVPVVCEHMFDVREGAELHRVGGKPLSEVLVEKSTYSRNNLKRRLLNEGLKEPRCELCGQDEIWRGRPMSLILDHINGIRDDNRLENLQMVCPNCAATLDTHCGRKNRIGRARRACLHCGTDFVPRYTQQRYCSRPCGVRWDRSKLRGGWSRAAAKSSGRRASSCWRKSKRRAIWPLVASTGSRTTQCASGFASTRDRSSGSGPSGLDLRPGGG